MTAISLATRGLRIGYHGQVVADIPDMTLGPGRVWLVAGPNGSGKSTLLKTLAGLLRPVGGAITPAPARGTGANVFVHSTPALFRGSVRHNLAVTRPDATSLHAVAEEFGLTSWLDQPVHHLSHGLRQRTAIARAILARPALLLLDEPEGGLDAPALAVWHAFAARVAADLTMTLVVAAHRPAGLEGVPTSTINLESGARAERMRR